MIDAKKICGYTVLHGVNQIILQRHKYTVGILSNAWSCAPGLAILTGF